MGDRTQGNTYLFNTGEGALLESTAQGEIELSSSQLVPWALGIAACQLFQAYSVSSWTQLSRSGSILVAVNFDCPAQTEKNGPEGLPSDSATPLRDGKCSLPAWELATHRYSQPALLHRSCVLSSLGHKSKRTQHHFRSNYAYSCKIFPTAYTFNRTK